MVRENRHHHCRFSNPVSYADALTSDNATYLTTCHTSSVSYSCHFLGRKAGIFPLEVGAPAWDAKNLAFRHCDVSNTATPSGHRLIESKQSAANALRRGGASFGR